MPASRTAILERFRQKVAAGRPLIGGGAGTGLSAKCEEAGGIDLIVIYNSGRYRMAGRGSLSGLMPYGNANQVVKELAAEVLTAVRHTPVLAGVCGTDPFMIRDHFLRELQALGFAGIQNFPTVGLIDGVFRANLEETGMSFRLEIDCIAAAHQLDLLTTPYAFDPEQARLLTEAGADLIVAHMGLTTAGMIGAIRCARSSSAWLPSPRLPSRRRRSAATSSSCATAARSPSPTMPATSSSAAPSKASTAQLDGAAAHRNGHHLAGTAVRRAVAVAHSARAAIADGAGRRPHVTWPAA